MSVRTTSRHSDESPTSSSNNIVFGAARTKREANRTAAAPRKHPATSFTNHRPTLTTSSPPPQPSTAAQPPPLRATQAPRRVMQHHTAQPHAIAATARVLQPTQASLARATTKRLTRDAQELAETRSIERQRRARARVAKPNGRVTVPLSPHFRTQRRAQTTTNKHPTALLTRTSRELLEIAALRQRFQATRQKVRTYHAATTRTVLSTAPTTTAAATTTAAGVSGAKASFAMALRSCGGLGVPAVRRAKLTQPIGFAFEIDKRLAQRKRASTSTGDDGDDGDSKNKNKRTAGAATDGTPAVNTKRQRRV